MSRQKNLKRNLLICLLAGSAVMYTLPLHAATSVVANNALPTLPMVNGQIKDGYGFVTGGSNTNIVTDGLQMNITQNDLNAVIKWGSFDVGGSATVNFKGPESGYNTLNYVNAGGSMSQIYGTINANNNGNIFIVNPAGVQIGNSAQINVGSLYVSNKYLNESELKGFAGTITPEMIDATQTADAALMSLGNINATNVTFEGDGRIVIDSERITNDANNATFRVNTNDAGNVLIGYDAYEETFNGTQANSYKGKDKIFSNVYENGSDTVTDVKGYMWVEDVEQLQAINTNLGGNYALRNSIDATSTDNGGAGFKPIGLDENGKLKDTGFTGKFDGIDYNIFGLTINNDYTNVGLFGETNGATINNVTLVGGSVTGAAHVGAVVGSALNGTVISNVINSASVNGIDGTNGNNIGGIVGVANDTTITNAVNTGAVDGKNNNVGGLVGLLGNGSTLNGNSYNLGDVSSEGHNVGGLVGRAVNSTIGNPSVVNGKPVENVQVVYNRLDVEGAYNVGGIVGNMEGTTVQNAENSGNVTASGYDNGEYTFHTDYTVNNYSSNGIKTVDVNVANVGGIAGTASANSTITDVLNTADVSSKQQNNNDYYDAGNVGGIVGSAVNTNISNATNKENEVRGAHNVGGVAGYFSGAGRITGGINDGGDIMATGARYTNDGTTAVVTETIRKDYDGSNNDGKYVIGNIGGIVGYMEGDNVHIDASGNRGTVHTLDISDGNNISDASEAANVGGIVGKIDRSSKIIDKNELGENYVNAAVSNSYNTGDVRGFTAIGGIAGMMYNGGIAGAYNLGEIRSTRVATGNETPLNMGGIVGDTTEVSNARAFIYDVYNKGKIGDEAFKYKGRHVGGIVGRLSGVVEKAYNTGAIYNGAAVTGGIAGYLSAGKIENVFNTGNITVENNDGENLGTQLGGLVGAANIGRGNVNISNAYNLGVIRSFDGDKTQHNVGGIVGYLVNYTSGIQGENAGNLTIKNVYTTGDLYSEGGETTVGALYGGRRDNVTDPIIQNAVYITPSNNAFTEVAYGNLQDATEVTGIYGSSNAATNVWNNFIQQSNVNNEGQTLDLWRVYDGTTPILNAFMPNSKDYFGDENQYYTGSDTGIDKIQYGTAYNPLLTIINANKDLEYDWKELGINNDAGLAVYGYGVTLNNFRATGGTGYFGGTIYADGALNLNGSSDIGLGSASQIYGSDVTIGTNGKVTIYGDVTATGNEKDNNDTTGSISINAGEVDVYGALTSAKKDQQIQISGIAGSVNPDFNFENITDKTKPVTNVGDRFAHEITASETGNITINAGQNGTGSGNVNLYYGNKQEGLITTGGNLIVTGKGDVYVDSDLNIGGDLTLTGNGENSEVVLDLTNIGQVQAKNGTIVDAVTGLHNFMHHFSDTSGGGVLADNKTISLNSASGNSKITVDMWDYENDKFDLEKYDETTASGHTFRDELNNLNLKVDNTVVAEDKVKEHIYIWVSDGEQLQGINATANDDGLDFNYALKGDINASDVENYIAIGTGSQNGFTGTFDGRGNRIIGLNVDGNNAGIFSTIGKDGTVKNVNIYSGNFTGTDNAGAVAGVNNGRIENIVTFGNTVTSSGNAGGIVGVNKGDKGNIITNEDGTITLEPAENEQFATGIIDVESIGSVIAEGSNAVAGGLVGTNEGALGNSYSDSAVTSTFANNKAGLGGVVGVNTQNGDVQYVDSLGVTNGGTNSDKVGGIIGVNNGNMYSGYNESIVSGKDNVGGIIGQNTGKYENDKWNGGTVENVVNATGVTGSSNYVGGLVGTNTGSVTNGRNNGTITGTNYVGGLVGNNADEHSILTNLVNDSSAEILGEQYVGGIAGSNSGTISATNDELTNRGSITGQKYVGGVAGVNQEGGIIENTISSIALHVKTPYTDDGNIDNDPMYFGGVVGQNSGTINGATNKSSVEVAADGATLVGGIIGQNTKTGTLQGEILNQGKVSGASDVGGIIGENQNASLLNNQTKDEQGNIIRLQITNEGNVSATKGGAAGIFYKNNITGTEDDVNANAINNVDIINKGTVTGGEDKNSVTGGLFGINTGNITNSTLTNTGKVTGGGTVGGLIGNNSGSANGSVFTNDGIVEGKYQVGGLFGINSGSFKTSSLINTVKAQVTGTQNVGGLIGDNRGNITGGRDAADSYYKYQIYNNGTINVTEEGTQKVGGLFGTNSGDVKAAYNTGVINADKSSNVGGIAGVNEKGGTLDQVFNTVMTGVDDKGNTVYGTITGKDNVGGLIGTNSGTLSNAYNTTGVSGEGGTIIGNNEGNVSDVYNTWNINGSKLIGKGKSTNTAYNVDSNNKEDYSTLDFTDTWKIYEGNSNPLLKVFLTNLTINETVEINEKKVTLKDYLNLVYNGKEQDLNIADLIEKGFITAPNKELLNAYKNTLKDQSNGLGESYLLDNADGQVDAKGYSDWLYSNQIAANTDGKPFNPNNLGYDITYTTEGGTIDIGKLSINITLDDIYRIYGNVGNIFSDSTTENKTTYEDSYHVNTDGLDDSLVNYIMDNLKVTFEDKAIDGDKTQNVGSYDWSMNVIIGGDDASNYQINSTGLQETIIKGENKSHVEKADLTITLDDVERIYGNIGFVNNTGYGITNVNGLTNGDEDNKLNLSDNANITDAALINVAGEERTNDVKGSPYDWTVAGDASNFTGVDNLGTNYNITVVAGNSKVTPKTVTIKDLFATIVYGNQDNKGLQINTGASLADGSIVYGDDVTLVTDNANYITGGKYDENRGNRVTADAGTYTDSLYVNGLSLNGNKAENYVLDTTSAVGDITVTKADLSITINGVGTTYGTAFDESQYGYTLDKLVNGDGNNNSVMNAIENAINNASGGYHNTGAADGTNGKVTQDAEGDYSLSFKNDITQKDVLTNYNITFVKDGDVNVSKKQIHIGADNEAIHLGATPDYTGTDINGVLVNGDKLNGNYHYGVKDSADEKVVGDHSIGVWIGNTFYDLSATVEWTKVDGFFSNYEVTYNPGTLTVTEQVMPDLPDNWPNNRWDYLFADNPFDRNENFRERKAEVNFVDGAMEI